MLCETHGGGMCYISIWGWIDRRRHLSVKRSQAFLIEAIIVPADVRTYWLSSQDCSSRNKVPAASVPADVVEDRGFLPEDSEGERRYHSR
jgi:hypothetical protein